MIRTKKFALFGQALIDEFPNQKQIGGAPLTTAVWLAKLRQSVSLITQVGKDEAGQQIKEYLADLGFDTHLIYETDENPTGTCKVGINYRGSATYDISFPAAWDKIEYTEEMENAVKESDAFIYGVVSAREDINFDTVTRLLGHAKYKILDVNLRKPFYDETVITTFCKEADFIKFNDDELFEIAKMYGSTYKSVEENLKYMQTKTDTETICVTKGKHGALIIHNDEISYFSGYRTDVVDTVGAGDAFLAAFLSKFLNDSDVEFALKYACSVGSFVASKRGANPKTTDGELEEYLATL